ncbi:MAG: FecR domain-containing protein [Chitinophagaceae bacterium]|nr:FecR domain-containing protein [Chitinophagaceae bacterium]
MSSNPIRLQHLFDKYVHNACTPEELKELWQLAGELSENDPIMDDIRDLWDTKKPSPHTLNSEDSKILLSKIMGKAKIVDIDYANIGHGQHQRSIWKRVAVAACFTGLIVAGGIYFLRSGSGAKNAGIPAPVALHDAQPGGNKAILTLGNGSQIVLAAAAKGQLARQGGSQVVKTDSGNLTYTHSKEGSAEVVNNTLSTPRGGKYGLTLADGTQVWLNASSSITYPTAFTGGERVVSITGEAYFEVAKNAGKPFHVRAGDVDVEVLGTHFNINAYSDEPTIKTTLLEGSVRVSKGSSHRVLLPGQQVLTGKGNTLVLGTDVDTEMEVAWKNNEFNFKDVDLKTVLRQLSRWYDLDIVYQDGAPVNTRFEGALPMNAMASQVLSVLEKNGVRFRLDGKQLTILPILP